MRNIQLITIVTCVAAAGAANATIVHTTTTPAGAVALTGSTVIDFESFAATEYGAITSNGLTITPDSGHQFIDGAYAGSYNTFGANSLHNCYCGDSFGALTFDFAAPVANFGFFFGASDQSWTLSTFAAGGTLIDSLAIGPTHGSNAGDFYYTTGGAIKSATLVGGAGDYIFIDNISFGGGTVPEPASWAMMIAGFGLVGAAMRRRSIAIA